MSVGSSCAQFLNFGQFCLQLFLYFLEVDTFLMYLKKIYDRDGYQMIAELITNVYLQAVIYQGKHVMPAKNIFICDIQLLESPIPTTTPTTPTTPTSQKAWRYLGNQAWYHRCTGVKTTQK